MTLNDFVPSTYELGLAAQILSYADHQGLGTLPAEAAVDVFERSGLSAAILAEIWTLSDEDASGALTEKEIAAVVRLIGWAQSGEIVREALLHQVGPHAVIDGISDSQSSSDVIHSTPLLPPITTDEKRVIQRAFMEAGPVHGLLDGDKVRDIFLKSNLSFHILAEIWNLADGKERGALDIVEFTLGMYLIHALKSCTISSVPTSIPSHIYEDLAKETLLDPFSQSGPSFPSPLQRPSPAALSTSALSVSASTISPGASSSSYTSHWDVDAHERLEYNHHFDLLDSQNRGFVDGDAAAKFMLKFKLPAEDRAHIWDLADIHNDNRLTRDCFAVAMHLIHRKLAGEEIPHALPPSLIPISLRPPLTAPVLRAASSSRQLMATETLKPRRRRASSPVREHIGTTPRLRRSKTELPVYTRYPSHKNNRHSVFDVPGMFLYLLALNEDEADYVTVTIPVEPLIKTEPSTPDNHALEELQEETKNLRQQVEELTSQLKSQNNYRDRNATLIQENELLKIQVRKMEHSLTQSLLAKEEHEAANELAGEIERLAARCVELEHLQPELEHSSRLLAVVTQDNAGLKAQLRDAHETNREAVEQLETLRKTIQGLQHEKEELSTRVSDMERSMAAPETRASQKELRVVLKDVTKENEKLKQRIREMEKSMTQLLLSGKANMRDDDLARENRRLTLRAQEMEALATQLQSSTEDPEMERVMAAVTQENEDLKYRLRDLQQSVNQMRTTNDAKIELLQRQVTELTGENNRLKVQAHATSSIGADHDPSIPPPSYDDAFSIP
ncbi:hypothetical protein BDQ12DRAFT_606218 [Crucibulum laeve]|uniref:Uncharacterized protein n=1 Tax=Crucibulum laeve TaxID=68775 RepID=A0A5C3M156_9AGAR|nr:hypothetical protein BDQ12DRAFT_606218 [Crucibulum laeve]